MKKVALLKTSILGAICLTALSVFQNSKQASEVKADDVVYDLTGVYNWNEDNAGVISVPNWKTSGKGIAFDLKFSDGVLSKGVVKLGNGSTAVSNQFYMWQYDSNNSPTKLGYYGGNCGSVNKIDDEWWHYELMFSNSGVTEVGSNTTFSSLILSNWGTADTNPNKMIRNFKIIDKYSSFYCDTVQNYTLTNDTFVSVPNWKSSGKGIGLNFKPRQDAKGEVHATFRGASSGNGTGSNLVNPFYLFNSSKLSGNGTIFEIGNGWYRYEQMFANMTAIGGTEAYNLNGLYIDWVLDGYGFECVSNIEVISGISEKLTYVVDGQSEETYKFIKSPVDYSPTKEGKHFSGWYKEDTYQTPYDVNAEVLTPTTIYAKFDDHSYEYRYDDLVDETIHYQVCSCGDLLESEEHVFDKKVCNDAYLVQGASCLHGNIYKYSCACGKAGTETFDDGNFDENIHVYGDPIIEVSVEATCEHDGEWREYHVCECGKEETIQTGVIEKNEHDYQVKEWKLNDDKTSATLTLECKLDNSHVVTVNASVNKVTIEPEVGKEGKNIYTLSATYLGKTYSKVIEENIPALEPEVEPEPEPEEPKDESKGCGGSLVLTSGVVSLTAVAGLILLTKKRKEK